MTIARKEIDDAVRSRLIWVIIAVFGAAAALLSVALSLVPQVEATPIMGVTMAGQSAQMLGPIIALIAAYLSIAGERESGSIKVLLGLPPSRGEVVLGKLLGRGLVVACGLMAGFIIAGVAIAVVYGSLPVVSFIFLTVLTGVLGLVFVGIAVGISAATATRARAMTLSIGLYLALVLFWDLLAQFVHLAVLGTFPGATVPGWYVLLQGLSPVGAYDTLTNAILAGTATTGAVPTLATRLEAGVVPVYLQSWVMIGVLLAWGAVPLVLGYLRFSRTDLA
uniref:ABC transporter permease subunit n=1 Tax=Haloprofundus sp. MHR1 TaxID=2572921 RepID=UPI001F25367F|nr:ABC transporter permease subunit [Haloprofundus sp. MHR1]